MFLTTTIGRRLVATTIGVAIIFAGAVMPSAAYATAPCSGVGQQVPGMPPPTYWNGCTYATAGLKARSHLLNDDHVTLDDPTVSASPYPFGTKVHIWCYLYGVWVTGPNGPTNIWDAVDFFQKPGGPVEFYSNGPFVVSSDAWIYTGSNNPVVPHC